MLQTTILDLLRHGEPVGGRKYRGQTDDPLSEKGWAEMRAAVARRQRWTAIVSSPMARCIAFSEWLAGETGLPLETDARLKEVGFGEWEGRTPDELRARDPEIVFEFKRDPVARRLAGAEALDAFYARVGAALDAVLAKHAGGHVLVVAHAGVIRMALCRVLGIPPENAYRLLIASASVSRIQVEVRGERRFESVIFSSGRFA